MQLEYDELPAEFRLMLRNTWPNVASHALLKQVELGLDKQLANLKTNCTAEEFQLKYAKLAARRSVYLEMQDFINNLRNGE